MKKQENWHQITNAFKEAAIQLRDTVMIGEAQVDSGEGKSLAGMLGVSSDELPTIRIFKIQKFMYEKYRLDPQEE